MTRDLFDIVIPTVGRPSLGALLRSLEQQTQAFEGRVFVVDDKGYSRPPPTAVRSLRPRVRLLKGMGMGPAAARNIGWRGSHARWVVFLDDDVLLPNHWVQAIRRDLLAAPSEVGASQGRIRVPLSPHRRPTDWERNTKGLENAAWATADMAYRRDALASVGGFDERFRHAYREDADLAIRVRRAGFELTKGSRTTIHPVRETDTWASVRLQRNNAYDPLMRLLHGLGWRHEAEAPRGRRPLHVALTALAAAAGASAVVGRSGPCRLCAAAWAVGTAELTWARIRPGPRGRDEVARMVATSPILPFAATFWWLVGWARAFRTRGDGAESQRRVCSALETVEAAS